MFGTIKEIFIVLLTNIVNASNHRKCMALSNQNCDIQPTLINLRPNEYRQEFHYYPFTVHVQRYIGGTWDSLILNHCFIVIYHHLSSYAVYS